MAGKVGHPFKPINPDQLLKLLKELYPTKQYVADFFGCNQDHISEECYRLFGKPFKQVKEEAGYDIKKNVFLWAMTCAERGDSNMIKYLLKSMNILRDDQIINDSTGQVIQLAYSIHNEVNTDVTTEEITPIKDVTPSSGGNEPEAGS